MKTLVDLHRYKDQIENDIPEKLKEYPPVENSILFYGSSTMAHWRQDDMCYKHMAPLKITNTGFGGSTAEEALYHYHQLVKPFKPGVIVYYEGPNDINSGYSPEDVLETTHRIFEWARQDFPNVQFIIVPIKVCPGLEKVYDTCIECNKLYEKYALKHEDTYYINLDTFLYDQEGNLRYDIYVEDLLHHTEAGYEEFATYVKPVVETVFAKYQTLREQ
jgi:lysophospholipase L1-like esterase